MENIEQFCNELTDLCKKYNIYLTTNHAGGITPIPLTEKENGRIHTDGKWKYDERFDEIDWR
jgi:hypothetical protein